MVVGCRKQLKLIAPLPHLLVEEGSQEREHLGHVTVSVHIKYQDLVITDVYAVLIYT